MCIHTHMHVTSCTDVYDHIEMYNFDCDFLTDGKMMYILLHNLLFYLINCLILIFTILKHTHLHSI